MRFKKLIAGMTAAALATGMMAILPASADGKTAADMPLNGTLLKADGSAVTAKAFFKSKDGSAKDYTSSVDIIRGENKLHITAMNDSGEETAATGISDLCIDFEDIYDQYPNLLVNVTKVQLISKVYNDDGTPTMVEKTDKETGEKYMEQKTKTTTLKTAPKKETDPWIDYSKIRQGNIESDTNNWRVEFLSQNGETKNDSPLTNVDDLTYDYVDITFKVWDDSKLEKQVFDNYVINADDPCFEGYYEEPSGESKGRAYRNFVYLCGQFDETDKTSAFTNCWDLSTVTAITYFIKGNEALLSTRDWSGFGIGISTTAQNWYQIESTNQVYQIDKDGNYVDADKDGYADLVKPASLVKIEDGLYAVTIVKQPGEFGDSDESKSYFSPFDQGARIWLNDWNNDESGEAVFQLDHIVLNPSEENVYIPDKIDVSTGEHIKQTYTKPTWDDFNQKDTDDNPTGEEDGILGDVNGDGTINVSDISMVAAHVKSVKSMNEAQSKRADVNRDGIVNVSDIGMLAAHVKNIKALPKA